MKKSFILYKDQRNIFEALSSKECKELLLAIFDFADGYEKAQSPRVEIALISIKNQLQRDADNWERERELRRESGRKGGLARARNAKESQGALRNGKQSQANQAVNVNVNAAAVLDNSLKTSNTPAVQTLSLQEAWDKYSPAVFMERGISDPQVIESARSEFTTKAKYPTDKAVRGFIVGIKSKPVIYQEDWKHGFPKG